MSAIRGDLDAAGITQTDIKERKTVGYAVFDWKVGQREKCKTTGTVLSDEKKIAYSERMKQVWGTRRANLSNLGRCISCGPIGPISE